MTTVEDLIKCLEGCDPKAEISVWPEDIGFSVIEYPGSEAVCLHLRSKKTGETILHTGIKYRPKEK